MITIAQANEPDRVQAVRDLMREYTSWALTIEDASDEAPTFQGLEAELATLPGIYQPPAGSLLIATCDSEPAGCVALKRVDATTSELKRMYVRPQFRGKRIGQRLVSVLVAGARALGYERIVLDSHATMTNAHAIYSDVGFRYVDAPVDFPEALKPVVVFMEMYLR